MTRRAMKEQVIYVMGGGEQWRPLIHIQDVVRIFADMLTLEGAGGETFNVGYDALNLRIADLAMAAHEAFPFAKIHNIPDGVDRRSYHVSFAKLSAVPKSSHFWVSIPQGIEEVRSELVMNPELATDPTTMTVAYYKSLIEWEQRLGELRLDGRIL
jgi:nucleoside-diphosphate-sugar epimerase